MSAVGDQCSVNASTHRYEFAAAALTFVVAFGLLLTWSLGIGRYGGPDEPAHVLRAASVAAGELVGTEVPAFVASRFRGRSPRATLHAFATMRRCRRIAQQQCG